MSTRMMKLLGATTAFIAASGIAQAQTYNSTTAITAAINTGNSASAVVNIAGSQLVSVTTNPAITISGTGAGTVGISSSAVVRGDSNGVIVTGEQSGLTGLTVNNSGTIQALGQNGYAISATNTATGAANLVVNNTGTISGSIGTTTGTLVYTGTGASSVVNGNLTSNNDAGTDSVTVQSGARINGNVSFGDGINNVTVSGTNARINGNYTGGSGVDTITLNNGGVLSGTVNVGAGANVISASNAHIIGNITAAGGADTLTLSNGASVSGNIDLGADDDTVTINGTSRISGTVDFGAGTDDRLNLFTTGYATQGAISNLELLNVSGTATLNHFVTGLTSATVNAGSTLTANQRFAIAGALNNKGTFHLTSGTVNLTDYTGSAGSNLILDLKNQASSTQLLVTNGVNLTNTSLTVVATPNSGFIASGTQYTLIDAGGVSQLPTTFLASNTGVYRYSLDLINGNNDVRLTVNRVSTSSVVHGSSYKNLAEALDMIATQANSGTILASNTTLYHVHGVIGSQTNAAGVQRVVESLAPNVDGIGITAAGVNVATANQISNRLASLRSGSALSGIATGNGANSRSMWVEGFGNRVNQDDRKSARGYDANTGGVSFGADTDTLIQGYTTGMAFSYANSSVESNAAGNANADIDTYVASLYGSRVMDNGMFVNAQANLGISRYDTERTVLGIGRATADFDGWQAGLKGEIGKDIPAGALTLTPLASLQYTYLDLDSYTETGAGGASLHVKPENMHSLDLGVGGQVAHTVALSNGGTLKPSAHAKVLYRMGDDGLDTNARFTGGGAAFKTTGVKADDTSLNLGAGLLLTTAGGVDFSVNYDADIRSSLTGHTGQLKARWAF